MIILAINKETGEVVLLKCCLVSHKTYIGKAVCQDGVSIAKKVLKDVSEGNLKNPYWMN